MNRRGMDGWMGRGREREMYFIVVFSNCLAGEKEKVGARRVCVLEERKEREGKREKERREKKGNKESARLVWMRTAKRARFGVVIYMERDWTRGFSAFVFFVLFSLLSVFFVSRECFFDSYSLPQDTSHDDDDNADATDATIISRVVSLHSHPGRGPTSPPRVSFGTFRQNIR